MPLLSATRKSGNTLSPPLPIRNSVYQQGGIQFRRGQFSLVAAAPGVGKTLTAANMAIRSKVPTMYFSADSDEWTTKQRAISILTGTKLDDVEKNLNSEQAEWWEDGYAKHLASADHVFWVYHTDISIEHIVAWLSAYAEMYGQYPELVVVDNMSNTCEDSQDAGELKTNCYELQAIARNTNAHVQALHHVMGDKENGDKPIYLADLIGKIGKVPELVLGLCFGEGRTTITMTVPKNRGGKPGTTWRLPIDYETATIGGYS